MTYIHSKTVTWLSFSSTLELSFYWLGVDVQPDPPHSHCGSSGQSIASSKLIQILEARGHYETTHLQAMQQMQSTIRPLPPRK